MTNRRSFIKQSAILAAGISADPFSLLAKKRKIGLQLYTMRAALAKDAKGTIEKIGATGYTDVETFGFNGKFFGFDPVAFKNLLSANNLVSTSGHYGLNNYLYQNASDDEVKRIIEAVKTLGQQYLTIPSLPRSAKSADDYKPVALRMNKAAALCKDAGVTLAYHNHDYTFKEIEGQLPQDLLMNETDPSLVDFEMDIYWVVTGGQDAEAWLKKYKNRFRLCHVKDRTKGATDAADTCTLGEGSIDFPRILQTAKENGMQYFIVEQEKYAGTTPLKAVEANAAYMKRFVA